MNIRSSALYPFEAGPLTPPVFYILLALAQGETHGYAIGDRALRDSGGRVVISSGTLYDALKRLTAQGFTEKVVNATGALRNYALTSRGEAILREEVLRYREAVAVANEFLLPTSPAS
ncbi:MAG TPA: PadR family transcriptional regulator [Candidatus Saccharimonadia bacterium]|nr:PadR family transcriptional regulator [Candidatus Saccharimonadia bacterium]